MDRNSPRWHQITPSEFPWEQEALDHVRELLPDREPFQAWSNFEFISDTGRVYEVDLLVVTHKGFFLVEIKSRPGSVEGNGGSWIWRSDGRIRTDDNPLMLANRKAKALRSLLDRQQAMRSAKARSPFLQAAVFLSAEGFVSRLSPDGAHHVYGRDGAAPGPSTLPSIRDGLLTIDAEQYARKGKAVDRPMSLAIGRAMEQAGIRPSNLQRRVGDYELGDLLYDGPGYQDFVGTHSSLKGIERRVRIYSVPPGSDPEMRRTSERAAEREFRTLNSLAHSSILEVHDYKVHDLGPALLFDYHPKALRLDRYLADYGERVDLDMRLSLIRQIAEALAYAHGRHVVHRALSPSSIEIVDPEAAALRVQVLNWQTSARDAEASSANGPLSATRHIDRLVADRDAAYIAPEVFGATEAVEQADVFSLGALSYLIFSGAPPAGSLSELVAALYKGNGLAIESVLDGASPALSEMVRWATHPEVSLRTESAQAFLEALTRYEEELTEPETETTVDPAVATVGDLIAPGMTVAKRLGQGSSAVVFQIVDEPADRVLKVAIDPDQNDRLRGEAEVLDKIRHPGIVRVYLPPVTVGDRVGIWMQRAGDLSLGQRLRAEGPLHLDLLQRFGDDLLEVVHTLEREGIAHRDIKPANLAVGPRTKKDELRLTLFDFSLSRTPRESIRAGTPPYLEPFLVHRTPARWDEHAERFAAAVTLYEMATAQLPVWGDGLSEPAALTCEVTVDQELFEPSLAPALAAFFRRTLARDPAERYPTARHMRDAWREAFEVPEEAAREEEPHIPINSATADTALRALALEVNVVDVLERASIYDVRALLQTPLNEIIRRRGVGTTTKRKIVELVTNLRRLVPDVEVVTHDDAEPEGRSIDPIAARLVPKETPRNAADRPILRALLGLDAEHDLGAWPGQSQVAAALDVPRRTIVGILDTARERWKRSTALKGVAADIVHIVDTHEGVLTTTEMASSLLAVRGSAVDDPERTLRALAVARAVVEIERARGSALAERRVGHVVLLAPDRESGAEAEDVLEYVARLADAADQLAMSDPLLAPAAVLARLDAVSAPADMEPLSDTRRVRLAAAASTLAAASSRLELYPRGMDAARSLRLAQTALLGPQKMAPSDIASRVQARFPDAAPLPDHPELDALLADAGLAYTWDEGERVYVAPSLTPASPSSRTSFSRFPTGAGGARDAEAEEGELFEQRLRRAAERGGFLALTTQPSRLLLAAAELEEKLPVTVIDVDRSLLAAMSEEAATIDADWSVVLRADAADRDSTDWQRLQQLVRRTLPKLEAEILAIEGVALLTRVGLLARYGQIGLIETLRDAVIDRSTGGLTGLWLLATAGPDGQLPVIDDVSVPVVTPDQWTPISKAWLSNAPRAAAPA